MFFWMNTIRLLAKFTWELLVILMLWIVAVLSICNIIEPNKYNNFKWKQFIDWIQRTSETKRIEIRNERILYLNRSTRLKKRTLLTLYVIVCKFHIFSSFSFCVDFYGSRDEKNGLSATQFHFIIEVGLELHWWISAPQRLSTRVAGLNQ